MVATFDHEDIEDWLHFTCLPAGTEGRVPDTDEGDGIAISIENDFIARTGLAIDTSNAKHLLLCGWIAELEMQKWSLQRFGNATSHSNPGGSVTFSSSSRTFTWDQFDVLVAEIKGGSTTSTSTVEMVDAYGNYEGFPDF